MSKYPFEHSKEGNLLYKVETYRLRYQGVLGADITLIEVPGENFGFEFEIEKNDKKWPELPSSFYQASSTDIGLQEELGMEIGGFFKEKEEALQKAITVIESLLDNYKKD